MAHPRTSHAEPQVRLYHGYAAHRLNRAAPASKLARPTLNRLYHGYAAHRLNRAAPASKLARPTLNRL
ncbi:hypothetical protein GCM10028798_11450 [Humibacter antri]